MIPPIHNILFETRFENRIFVISDQIQYLENQFDSNFLKVREQVTINTYHLARDQHQISRLTENTEFLTKEILKINESITNLKLSIEVLTSRQIKFEENTNQNLAVLNKKVELLTEQFKTLLVN